MAAGTVCGASDNISYAQQTRKAAQQKAGGTGDLFWEKMNHAAQMKAQSDGGEAADTKNAKEAFDYHQFFQDKINEIYTKVKNGYTEPKFQIGALSLSQKEWNKFLEEYDEIQDIIREMMREEQEKREAECLQKEILEKTAGSGMTEWEPVIG